VKTAEYNKIIGSMFLLVIKSIDFNNMHRTTSIKCSSSRPMMFLNLFSYAFCCI